MLAISYLSIYPMMRSSIFFEKAVLFYITGIYFNDSENRFKQFIP